MKGIALPTLAELRGDSTSLKAATPAQLMDELASRCDGLIFMGHFTATNEVGSRFTGNFFQSQGMALEIIRQIQDTMRQNLAASRQNEEGV